MLPSSERRTDGRRISKQQDDVGVGNFSQKKSLKFKLTSRIDAKYGPSLSEIGTKCGPETEIKGTCHHAVEI